MRVLCVEETKKIVKGCIYDVYFLNCDFDTPTVSIYGMGNFDVKYFKLEDGSPVPTDKNWSSDKYLEDNETMISVGGSNVNVGDVLVYRYDNSKILVKNKKYKVSEVKRVPTSGIVQTKIKIEGHKTWLYCACFRKCTKQEERDLSVDIITDSNTETLMIEKDKRKLDQYTDDKKNFILLKLLTSSILDRARNNMDIVSWAVRKGKQYGVVKDDFNFLLNKNVNDILLEFENIDFTAL